MQGLDLNQRPSGYEPDELPGCSTLQCGRGTVQSAIKGVKGHFARKRRSFEAADFRLAADI